MLEAGVLKAFSHLIESSVIQVR